MNSCLQTNDELNNFMPLLWNAIKGYLSDPLSNPALPINPKTFDQIEVINIDGLAIIRLGNCSGIDYIKAIDRFPTLEKMVNHIYDISENQLSYDNFEIIAFIRTDQIDLGIGVIVRFKKDYYPGSFDIYMLNNSSPQIELCEWAPSKYLTDEQASELVMAMLSTHSFEVNDSAEMVIIAANAIVDEIGDVTYR